METKPQAPYSIASLVLGICSIIFGCAFIGLACGIVGLIFSNKSRRIMQAEPDTYDGEALVKAGQICSIVGIVLGGFYILRAILVAGTLSIGLSAFGASLFELINLIN
ncbi:MAG: hypothetical protein IJ761_07855 [Bacteroidales bacterium]|nr:hypothetical protein [Bacteroidales bacterium]